MIEWVENGEYKNDAPEPSLKVKIVRALMILCLLIAGPDFLEAKILSHADSAAINLSYMTGPYNQSIHASTSQASRSHTEAASAERQRESP